MRNFATIENGVVKSITVWGTESPTGSQYVEVTGQRVGIGFLYQNGQFTAPPLTAEQQAAQQAAQAAAQAAQLQSQKDAAFAALSTLNNVLNSGLTLTNLAALTTYKTALTAVAVNGGTLPDRVDPVVGGAS